MTEATDLGREPAPNAERDAIHVAILPAVAKEHLKPGERVRLDFEQEQYHASRAIGGGGLGIADPFRVPEIGQGSRVWIMLDPGTITDMRHHWTHPGLEDIELSSPTGVMQRIADQIGVSFEVALEAGDSYMEDVERGIRYPDQHVLAYNVPSYDRTAYWKAWADLRGRSHPEKDSRDGPFTCSCG